ncbi:MAG: cytochrome c [Variibacter sp.]|nr:cytochrome c [Variibacter sp.]
MLRTVLVAAVMAFGVTAVVAQDPIATRKELMKGVGAQARLGTQMSRGEAPYDQAKALAIFTTYMQAGEKLPTLFPETSKTGGETAAAPKIWEDMADFRARAAKFSADAKAVQASVKDLETFKTAFSEVGKNCGGCHENYRIRRN